MLFSCGPRPRIGLARPTLFAVGILLASSSLADAADGSHPVVPGFERLFAADGTDAVRGGRLLLGELNCTSCHRADQALDGYVLPKRAPLLDGVGARVQPKYLRLLLSDPQHGKAGTTMPNLLAGRPESERKEIAESLTHYLASTGQLAQQPSRRDYATNGSKIYHQVGCVACHGPRDSEAAPLATSVPLPDLAAKYTIPSLMAFLKDPLAVRPSGRMPHTNLNDNELRDLAHYLIPDAAAVPQNPNLNFTFYEGGWENLPDFDKLQPASTGKAAGFDLYVGGRDSNLGIKFTGFLRIPRDGEYTFHLTSDDGSRLLVDGKQIVDNDGTHAATTASGKTTLTAGMHPLTTFFFNAGGPMELRLEIEGAGLGRQDALPSIFLTEKGPDAPKKQPEPADSDQDAPFVLDPAKARAGEALFASLGCASCHGIPGKADQPAPSLAGAKPLEKLAASGGCLSATPRKGVPYYSLSTRQQTALVAAIKSLATLPTAPPTPQDVVAHTMATFNCYACHQRDKIGGVEQARNAWFTTTKPEMGDEGRIPPHLDGVGAKLRPEWLREVFNKGAKDRPYMHTEMPRFGEANVGGLIAAFAALDKIEPVPEPKFAQSIRRVKSDGRHLVGNKAFSCTKCHNFGSHQGSGIQAMDLQLLTRRLNRDWFHRYMLNPSAFRPGTRMPASWPEGQVLLPDVLDGDAAKQIEAVWLYLSDGGNAALPYGAGSHPIELVPDKTALIYRNFITDAGTRAIAVGYPEKANLAFDANDMRLALIWQGPFIDASKHWIGRGAGFQPPLGNHVMKLPEGASFAVLADKDATWPKDKPRESGYKFHGYQLVGPQLLPTFLYEFGKVHVEDLPVPIQGANGYPGIRRELKLAADELVANLYFRAEVADKIAEVAPGQYKIDDDWLIRIDSTAKPEIRRAGNQDELLVPIQWNDRQAKIVQTYEW